MGLKKNIAEEICIELLALKYTEKSYVDGKPYNARFITNQDGFTPLCIQIINNKLFEVNSELATLQAKVTAYEAIIQNSNFAMAVLPKHKPTEEDPS